MLFARIEMWPKGDRTKAYTLGEAAIANVGGTDQRGDYEVLLSKFGGFGEGKWKAGAVKNFPRKSRGPFDLFFRALASLVADRNPRVAEPAEQASIDDLDAQISATEEALSKLRAARAEWESQAELSKS